MHKVVCFGYPARGHTVPSLPVVAELIRQGCDVDYYSVEPYRALIESSGARFVPYPALCESLMRPADLDDHLVRGVAVTAELLPQLLQEVSSPDLVLCDASALWGQLFARTRGVPCVLSITTFAFTRAMLQLFGASPQRPPLGWDTCASAIATLNEDYAANIGDHLDLMAPDAGLKLVYTSTLLQPGGKFLDARHVFVGPLLAGRAREGDEVAQANAQRPLAYVSLGTIFNRDHALLRRIASALVADGWRVLVSLGDAAAAASGDWPEGVDVHAFVDQIGVLREAKLFVTHGGMNSVSEALAQSVPLVVIPQSVDQHVVARRAASLGAGIVIAREQTSAENLQAAFARIAREHAAFTAAADSVRRSFDEVTPLAEAVERMLSLPVKVTPMLDASDADLQRERESLAALWVEARRRQQEAQARSPEPSRFIVESARAMAMHLGLTDGQMQERLDALALWQFHLPAAVSAKNGDYAITREALPASFARIRAALQEHETRQQLVLVAFHMTGFPLLTALMGAALKALRAQRPLHAVVASNNIAWLQRDRERWEACGTHFIGTQPRDMRTLLCGLRAGSIERLLILVDGPHAPGPAGTRALSGISDTLGFRTALLERLHALGLPLLPIAHHWRDESFVITPHALLDPAHMDANTTIDTIATHIETLLRAQPEQWLNWAAARIRT